MIKCKICGKEFEPPIHNQLCCSYDCKIENKKITNKAWLDKQRALKMMGEPAPKRKKKENNKVNLKKFPKNLFYDKDINEEREERIAKSQKESAKFISEARALGLSYGQYTAKLELEKRKEDSIEFKLKKQKGVIK